jgi:hypothetical protein
MSATWSSLSGARVGTPELKGGRCVGEWEIFDNEHGSAELEEYAINLCQACPALAECRSWFESLKPSKRPIGVVAGRVVRQQTKVAA